MDGRVKRRAGMYSVVTIDCEQIRVERSMVVRIHDERIFGVFGEIGALAPRQYVSQIEQRLFFDASHGTCVAVPLKRFSGECIAHNNFRSFVAPNAPPNRIE